MKNNKTKNWLSSIPEEIKEVLMSPELSEKLVKISTEYGLSEKVKEGKFIVDPRTEKLIELVIKTLKGELSLKDFNESLGKELNVDSATAKEIITTIDQEIFSDIKASLGKTREVDDSEEKTSVKPPPVESEKKQPPRKSDIYRETIK